MALVTAAPEQQVDTAAVLGRAREAVAAAWDYYRQQAAGSWAPRYLAGRGLDPTLAGYAPTGWTKLVGHLHGQGFTDLELLAASLARTGNRDGALIDRISNRVMLPIHDRQGRVTAFVGRKHRPHRPRTQHRQVTIAPGEVRAPAVIPRQRIRSRPPLHDAGPDQPVPVGTRLLDNGCEELIRPAAEEELYPAAIRMVIICWRARSRPAADRAIARYRA